MEDKEKKKIRDARYRERNRERLREKNKVFGKNWRVKNKDKIKRYYKTYHQTPDFKLKNLRRANNLRFGGLREQVLERDRWSCVNCNLNNQQHILIYGRGITVDHIDGNGRDSSNPNNALDNLQTLCLSCHGKKDIKMKGGKQNEDASTKNTSYA